MRNIKNIEIDSEILEAIINFELKVILMKKKLNKNNKKGLTILWNIKPESF